MGMNRRGFLGALATGLVGACVATKIPTAILPAPVRTRAACEFLRKAYNDYSGGQVGRHPREMFVGRELFEAFEGELIANERFVTFDTDAGYQDPALRFKGAKVRPEGRGWTVRIVG